MKHKCVIEKLKCLLIPKPLVNVLWTYFLPFSPIDSPMQRETTTRQLNANKWLPFS